MKSISINYLECVQIHDNCNLLKYCPAVAFKVSISLQKNIKILEEWIKEYKETIELLKEKHINEINNLIEKNNETIRETNNKYNKQYNEIVTKKQEINLNTFTTDEFPDNKAVYGTKEIFVKDVNTEQQSTKLVNFYDAFIDLYGLIIEENQSNSL